MRVRGAHRRPRPVTFSCVSVGVGARKGGCPTSISKRITPTLHQSHSCVYPAKTGRSAPACTLRRPQHGPGAHPLSPCHIMQQKTGGTCLPAQAAESEDWAGTCRDARGSPAGRGQPLAPLSPATSLLS